MKKLYFLLIALMSLTVINSYGQSRENKQNATFETKSPKLTSAVGWKLNKTTGKWVENNNVIDDNKTSPYLISYKRQNFNWIQLATVNYGGNRYYVLLDERKTGVYKYPSIREDWQPYNETNFMVLTPEEYGKLKQDINSRDGKDIVFETKRFGSIHSRFEILGGEHLYNDENLLAAITKKIEEPYFSSNCLIINSQVVDGADLVRFRLLESCYVGDGELGDEYFEVATDKFKVTLLE